ncbi:MULTISPECIES: type II toxin-antitoxin system RelE family toxin [Planktothricoides]|uniref:Type II toxin-antitoxin system RelE/ParE family toxin n=2 Tax=Planktothricoides raciborskii TaxID=132608 RepID=A0AAU8J7P2_9CYAN|nr:MULTISPECIES: type II toxin-antitoxin system RelE/ParE family toxin [Planktothricoides]KOR36017.1 plasmid stabilization protein [Planktothricoides sp. SR001]MBD2545572.1 type II toxin-antitoxin system RelE/ParE family toxin [Planktothricoides raciborskii FACHB-1370]MBD2583478.1 type II toxin-antitoxin system RelE/ParE family toxin [Planktothricoides raciborskii FACHB-1261]
MKTEYKPSFLKDLKALKSTPSFETIKALAFTEIPNLQKFEEIGNLKRLKGDDNAYRIRIGDYRLGIFFDGETVIFARVLHRKDIYRYFP